MTMAIDKLYNDIYRKRYPDLYKAIERMEKRFKQSTLVGTCIVNRKAIAETSMKLPVSFVISPLDIANSNKQGIKSSEANNLIVSASLMSINANYDPVTEALLGHSNAKDIGVVVEAYQRDNIVYGNGYIWKKHSDIVQYLQEEGTVGSSWELFYSSSDIDSSGVEWLKGVSLVSVCLVSAPAFGTLTPLSLK